MQKKKIPCRDCGNAPVNHTVEKSMIVLAYILDPITHIFDGIWNTFEPLFGPFLYNKFTPAFFKFLAKIHLGKIAHEPDDRTGGRARCFWNEAKKRGIDMWEFRLFNIGRELFVASYGGVQIGFDGLPRPGKKTPPSLLWVDNKGIMREKFIAQSFPVAKGGVVSSFNQAKKMFAKLSKPVIIKPNLGSRSRHTTTHIETIPELYIAYKKAKMLSPWVIVEEELSGMVHRGTVIGGKLIGILRREPASVIGDGIHSVLELIEIENKNPERSGPIFHKIALHDSEHDKELSRIGLTLNSIPEKDKVILLSQKASRGLGGGATDLTDEAHPDNILLLENVAKFLDDSLVGIDFIIDDVSRSWKEQPRAGIIECNSLPFIDLHMFPLKGKVRNTPGALWDLIFPDSNPQK